MEKYLTEAFEALNILNEETFDISADGIAELQNFKQDEQEIETIIDPLAQTEEDLQDSYIGKAILDCTICQSKIYKDPEEVIISEAGDLANVGEVCPYCQSSDGFKVIGQVAEYKPEEEIKVSVDGEEIEEGCKSIKEDFEKVEVTKDGETIKIEAEPSKEKVDGEMIAPLTDEVESEFKTEESEYQDIEIDEFDEKEFDELGEKYLRRVYENVASYKTVKGSTLGNKLKLEGIISFKSGKKAKTNFVFEAKSITKTGKLKFLGENKQFARGKQAFTLTGKALKGKLIAESLTYNYRAKNEKDGSSKKLYGTVAKRSK